MSEEERGPEQSQPANIQPLLVGLGRFAQGQFNGIFGPRLPRLVAHQDAAGKEGV